jgi:methylated-DNA-[protein]-cysteine S-methyltransferase
MTRPVRGKQECADLCTEFQRSVYRALCRVAPGTVTTYGRLARAVGCRSARAIGQALRRNPHAPRVPCHRVIREDGTPGGFEGKTGGSARARKLRLLAGEGVLFRNGRMADPGRIVSIPGAPTSPHKTR